MADPRRVAPSPAVTSPVPPVVTGCPAVADLIGYALGRAGSEECLRIDAHLDQLGCRRCRAWIESARRGRAEPLPDPPARATCSAALMPLLRSPAPPPADQTPIPVTPAWQSAAFRDLEQRLRRLEEG